MGGLPTAVALLLSGCSGKDATETEPVATTEQAVNATQSVSIQVPSGAQPSDVLLSATESLRCEDRVRLGKAGRAIRVASFGSNSTELGSGVELRGSLVSQGSV